MNNNGLVCEGISHGFGARQILKDVSFGVEPGQSLAIVGPNGAGKTTLLRILAGLLTPQSGRVLLGKDALDSMKRREVARRISVVPQARPQVFDYSALELVLMGFHARTARFSLPSQSAQQQALAVMERLEVAHLAHQPASVLSGGELQRTLMARTMVSEAGVWLLDEPTASLDLRHQLTLLEEVQGHCVRGGSAVAILHDLGLVHRYFDRVAVLSGSRLVTVGAPDEVLTEACVGEVFGVSLRRGEVAGRVVWVAG